jgi:hypothetical protein
VEQKLEMRTLLLVCDLFPILVIQTILFTQKKSGYSLSGTSVPPSSGQLSTSPSLVLYKGSFRELC